MKIFKLLFAFCLSIAGFFPLNQALAETQNPETELLFDLHFAGLKTLKVGDQGVFLKNILTTPGTKDVQQYLAKRMAETGLHSFCGTNAINTLLDNEIYVLKLKSPEVFVFAAKLGPIDALGRYKAAKALIPSEKAIVETKTLPGGKAESWTVPSESGSSKTISYGNGWFLYASYPNTAKDLIPQTLTLGEYPLTSLGTNYLTLKADWEEIGIKAPLTENFKKIDLTCWQQGDNVRSKFKVQLKDKMNLSQAEWKLPKDIVSDPTVQFTALRGSDQILAKNDFWKSISGGQISPDQCYLYAHNGNPFSTTVLLNTTNSLNGVKDIGNGLNTWFTQNYKDIKFPQMAINTNAVELGWFGWPLITPFVRRAINNESAGYVMCGLILKRPHGKPLSDELWGNITKDPKLFYYSWEITGYRLPQWQAVNSLFRSLLSSPVERKHIDPKTATKEEIATQKKELNNRKLQKQREEKVAGWIVNISKNLGNCITTGIQESEDTLVFERQSACGFTALELWFLTEWIMDR